MLTLNHRHNHSHHMACFSSSTPFSFLLLTTLFFFFPCFAIANEPLPSPNLAGAANNRPPPSITTLYDIGKRSSSGFKPGVAILIGVLTLVFSLTFILLLYIKHCSGGDISTTAAAATSSRAIPSFSGRKNSGIDRSVVESLPIFRFGSLTGQKEGLDCAVCLSRFESTEVLRLLPKCKHAFHVECVDTWLDAHSTCPLCRYRVDPEDILLVESHRNQNNQNQNQSNQRNQNQNQSQNQRSKEEERCSDLERGKTEIEESRRRHASVGETESERERRKTMSFRWSLDSATATSRKKSESVGCFVRPRKDGMLLTQDDRESERISLERRRLEHRIIVSPTPRRSGGGGGIHQRWSDVQSSDLLYLTSEMILSESRRVVNSRNRMTGIRVSTADNSDYSAGRGYDTDLVVGGRGSWNGSRGIINSRSVSEITGLSRFSSNNNNGTGTVTGRRREEGLVTRWMAWISQSHHVQTGVR